ncbi:MAG: hypothetical protein JWQ38_2525 [Flavipsychrobacter sp.]|nr:hypothetical protein [Flavipsychrobacter sp.]
MYRILCSLICLAVCWPALTYARQDSLAQQRHLFSVSYGILTGDHLLVGYHVGRTSAPDFENKGTPGALCLGYKYRVNNKIYIGLTAAMEQQHGDWLNSRTSRNIIGAFVRSSFTIAADFTCNYTSHDLYRIYMVAGVGVTYGQSTRQYSDAYYITGYYDGVNQYGPMRIQEQGQHANGYFCPLGLSVGRRLSYFAEVGFGYKGVLNTGLTYSIK